MKPLAAVPLAMAMTLALAVAPGRSGSGSGICEPETWTLDGDEVDCRLGTVARAGDVNGDGYDDFLVGSYFYDHPEVNEGIVQLFLGGPAGPSPTAACTLEVNQAGARFGDKLSSAGDVNGDGYDDVILGAGEYDHPEVDEGMAFLFLGSPGGLITTPAWTAEMNQPGAQFGASVAGAGDVDGDGFDDVFIGSLFYDHGETDEGAAFVYLGSDTGLADTPVWMGESNSTGAIYSYHATGAGDLNGDGYDEIVVGARRYSGDGVTREGRAYVYYGSPSGPAPSAGWVQDGNQSNAEFGSSVNAAGDIDHDGFDDLIVSAFRWNGANGTDVGKAFLYRGGPSGIPTTPAWTREGEQANMLFSYHCAPAGDVNRDGFGDLVVGAPEYDSSGVANLGRAYVFLGSATGLPAEPDWVRTGDQGGGQFGNAVSPAGDVDGDGFDDILVGALYRDITAVDAGRAYLFHGCGDGITAVGDPGARGLALAIEGRNPFGRHAHIGFAIPRAGMARVTVYDAAGRRVAVLSSGALAAGSHRVVWEADGAPAGTYFVRLECAGGARATRLVHLR